MRKPNPPFLELQFYFGSKPDSVKLVELALSLHGLGATFTGLADIHRGTGVVGRTFARVTDEPVEQVSITLPGDLQACLANPDIRLVRVYMEGATGTVKGVAEVVTLLDVSPVAATRDRHPLAIWTDGGVFSGPIREQAAYAMSTGRRAYRRFLELIEATKPDYAAITSEYSLPCLTDLRMYRRSAAFRDFYVSGELLGPSGLNRICTLFSGAYVSLVGPGVYVSTVKEFNPPGIYCDIEWALMRSDEVAAILARSTLECDHVAVPDR